MDVTTYSSSFESDEDSTQVKERAENVGSRNLEFDVLCEGIRHLSLDSGKYTEGETKSSRWVLEKSAKNTKCLQAEFGNNSYSSKLDIQNLNILKSVFYLNKKETCFKGSASINRRKKMQQIEHDNLVRSYPSHSQLLSRLRQTRRHHFLKFILNYYLCPLNYRFY